jgi:hypothetical protein
MKPTVLLAFALLAGCSAVPSPSAIDVGTLAAAAPEPTATATAPTASPTPAPAVGASGTGVHARKKGLALGKPYRRVGLPKSGGGFDWSVFVNIGGASKVFTVTGDFASSPQDVKDPDDKYKAYHGEGLTTVNVDSDVALKRAAEAGLPKVDAITLYTDAEFAALTGKKVGNPLWRVRYNSFRWTLDAVTGVRFP